MAIETSTIHREMVGRLEEIPSPSGRLMAEFDRIQDTLREQGKYIVRVFPEYTPHDPSLHLDHLFPLADRLLGSALYERLNAAELTVLAFSLFAQDWGMAVSEAEQAKLRGESFGCEDFCLLPNEPSACLKYLDEADAVGTPRDQAWANYLRRTHGLRSGARLRRHLAPLSEAFAEAVARAAEGHTLSTEDIRNPASYPIAYPLFGQLVNLAAVANYVRIIDLLDIGEDRTPFALWKFVQPQHPISSVEWKKHRSLSPVSVRVAGNIRQVVVGGITDDVRVYAALADLRSWVDAEFQDSMINVRNLGQPYALDLDTRIEWNIQARGFEPEVTRFEIERSSMLGLLSSELYESQPFAFVRELLQNSVDAIDVRQALLERAGVTFRGRIQVSVSSDSRGVRITWTDNGIGMDSHVIRNYFSVIGRSWYRSEEYKKARINVEPISRFGVGFLSCFSVADRVLIRTRQNPSVGTAAPGYSVEIPDRNSHFRIAKHDNLPIGTEIQLFVRRGLGARFQEESLARHLQRFGAYVRHEIVLDMGGLSRSLPSFERISETEKHSLPFELTPILEARPVVSNSEDMLSATTRRLSFSFGGSGEVYNGHYSAIVPLEIDQIEKVGNWEWRLAGRDLDLQSYIHNSADDVFVKGILAGPLHFDGRHGQNSQRLTSGARNDGDWIGPKVSMNLSHPSLVEFNLARTSASVGGNGWRREAWTEISNSIRSLVFGTELESPMERALAIGVASRFAGIPSDSLVNIVPASRWPALILFPGEGIRLTTLAECTTGDRMLEVPLELSYALTKYAGQSTFLSDIRKLTAWPGPPAVLVTTYGGSHFPYWVEPLISSMPQRLREAGFSPTEIATFRITGNEKVPLVCRIWTRDLLSSQQTAADFLGTSDRDILNPFLLSAALGREFAPQLFPFPDGIADFAAIGSAYWNSRHPKVKAIVAMLLRLSARVKSREAPQASLEKFRNLTSTRYNDYVVPSCRSRRRLALNMHAELLALAAAEGLGVCSPLGENDALPGSVGGYENPYHYSLHHWEGDARQV